MPLATAFSLLSKAAAFSSAGACGRRGEKDPPPTPSQSAYLQDPAFSPDGRRRSQADTAPSTALSSTAPGAASTYHSAPYAPLGVCAWNFLHPRSAIIYNTKNKLMGRYMNSQFFHHHMPPQMADSRQGRQPGIPQQPWARPCAVATARAPARRAMHGIKGGAGCRLVLGLARYTPRFWPDIRPVFG